MSRFKVGDRVRYGGDVLTVYEVLRVEHAGWPHKQFVSARADGVGDGGAFDESFEPADCPQEVSVAAEELARLRRIEDAYRKDNLRGDGHKGEQWCERCERWCELSRTLIHASDCDVAIHLGLPREKGDGE